MPRPQMPSRLVAARKPAKFHRDRVRKRRLTLFSKANEIHRLGAKVYVALYYYNKFYVYTSTDNPKWPPSAKDVKRTYPMPDILMPAYFKSWATGKPTTLANCRSHVIADSDDGGSQDNEDTSSAGSDTDNWEDVDKDQAIASTRSSDQ
ncbi:hypothetical protein F5B21DRAFT_497487 [Xylaria acuta]|nr:hypothetical protein F5B21DRAFT_497487 [Xylaria acuta]